MAKTYVREVTPADFQRKKISVFLIIGVLIFLFISPIPLIFGIICIVLFKKFNNSVFRLLIKILSFVMIVSFAFYLSLSFTGDLVPNYVKFIEKMSNILGYNDLYPITRQYFSFQSINDYGLSSILNAFWNFPFLYKVRYLMFWTFLSVIYPMTSIARYELRVMVNPLKNFDDGIKYIPAKKSAIRKLERIRTKKRTINVALGINEMIKNFEFYIPQDDLNRHTCLIGTTGSGKTVTLYNYLINAIYMNKPIIFIDAKGDYSNIQKFNFWCNNYGRNPTIITIDGKSSYNPFASGTPTELTDKIIGMFDWSEEHYKLGSARFVQLLISFLQHENILVNLPNILKYSDLNTLKGYGLGLTKITSKKAINDQPKPINEEEIDPLDMIINENSKVDRVDNNNQLYQVDEKYIKTQELINTMLSIDSKIVSGLQARIASIAEGDSYSMLSGENPLILDELIQNKGAVLFSLDSLRYPQQAKGIGRLIINDIKTAVSSHQRRGGGPVNLTFDEFNVFASHDVVDIVNKARSAGFEALISFQSLSDIDKLTNGLGLRRQIIQNCNTLIVQRQNDDYDAQELAKVIGKEEKLKMTVHTDEFSDTGHASMKMDDEFIFKPSVIKNLETGQAVLKVGNIITRIAVIPN